MTPILAAAANLGLLLLFISLPLSFHSLLLIISFAGYFHCFLLPLFTLSLPYIISSFSSLFSASFLSFCYCLFHCVFPLLFFYSFFPVSWFLSSLLPSCFLLFPFSSFVPSIFSSVSILRCFPFPFFHFFCYFLPILSYFPSSFLFPHSLFLVAYP